jgi:sarcosine dehydrogenase
VTSSAGYGHTIGSHIAYGYVPAEAARATEYEVEAFCHRLPARRFEKAPYDPERKKILA